MCRLLLKFGLTFWRWFNFNQVLFLLFVYKKIIAIFLLNKTLRLSEVKNNLLLLYSAECGTIVTSLYFWCLSQKSETLR